MLASRLLYLLFLPPEPLPEPAQSSESNSAQPVLMSGIPLLLRLMSQWQKRFNPPSSTHHGRDKKYPLFSANKRKYYCIFNVLGFQCFKIMDRGEITERQLDICCCHFPRWCRTKDYIQKDPTSDSFNIWKAKSSKPNH